MICDFYSHFSDDSIPNEAHGRSAYAPAPAVYPQSPPNVYAPSSYAPPSYAPPVYEAQAYEPQQPAYTNQPTYDGPAYEHPPNSYGYQSPEQIYSYPSPAPQAVRNNLLLWCYLCFFA